MIGAASGIPLGVLNAALVEAATRVGRRHAIGLGVGGALADGSHAALAFAGVAPVLARHHDLHRVLLVVSGVIVVGYAALVLRRRRATVPTRARTGGSFWRGVLVGVSLTLPNPAALLAWVAVAGAVVPDATVPTALAGALGVTVGSGAWFIALAHLASRGTPDGALGRWLPRVVAVLLVAFGAWTLWRAFAL